jgi:cardiolipin synthase
VPTADLVAPEPSFPVTAVEYQLFVEGDVLYAAMLEDIAAARTTIRMESYIFAADAVGRRIAAALIAQARKGRRVELRVDYAGSRWELGRDLVRELKAAGVHFEWSHRWQWSRPWAFHRRNHRKLLIVDDAIAYLGGFNVHVASSREFYGEHRWRDTHVRFRGPAVNQAIDLFERSGCREQSVQCASSPLWVVPGATRRCRQRLRCELDRAFRMAKQRIWLTTPYFVPDRRLRRRLIRAARRGVDVQVLTPAKNDVPIAQWAARALYSALLKHGVRVYEYQPRVLHAKTLIVDDRWATVGSANFDYRSLFLNAEVNLVSTDRTFCEALADQFRTDLQLARAIDPERWRRRSWSSIARERFAWPLRRWL